MRVFYNLKVLHEDDIIPLVYRSEIPFYPVAGQIIDIGGERFTIAGVLWVDNQEE